MLEAKTADHCWCVRSMPILANEEVVPGMDPHEISTWRFEMTLAESGQLMDLAEVSSTFPPLHIQIMSL